MRVLVKVKKTTEILLRCELNAGMFERDLVFRPYFLCDHGLCAYQVDNLSDTVELVVGDLTRDDHIVAMAERIFDESPDTFALAGTPGGQEIVGNGLWVPRTWRSFLAAWTRCDYWLWSNTTLVALAKDHSRKVKRDNPVWHVDDFGDAKITADAHQHVGVFGSEAVLCRKAVNHGAAGVFGGLHQIREKAPQERLLGQGGGQAWPRRGGRNASLFVLIKRIKPVSWPSRTR